MVTDRQSRNPGCVGTLRDSLLKVHPSAPKGRFYLRPGLLIFHPLLAMKVKDPDDFRVVKSIWLENFFFCYFGHSSALK